MIGRTMQYYADLEKKITRPHARASERCAAQALDANQLVVGQCR